VKNKPKIGNLTEKQAQHPWAGKLNANLGGKSKKQAQNEQILTKTHPICHWQ